MSLRRIRQAAVERAAEAGARAALEATTPGSRPAAPTPSLSLALEMVALPDEGAGAAVVRAVGARQVQAAWGNGEASQGARTAGVVPPGVEPQTTDDEPQPEAERDEGEGMSDEAPLSSLIPPPSSLGAARTTPTTPPARQTLADLTITILPLPGGLARLREAGPLAEAAALLGEEATAAPETSPASATTPDLPPPSDAVSEGQGVEAAVEAVVAEETTGEATTDDGRQTTAGEEEAVEGVAEAAEGDAEGEAAEAEAAAAGEEAAAGGEAAAEVPILMPEPPADLTPPAQERLAGTQAAAGGAARRQAAMPPAGEHVSAAQGAVTPPEEEMAGRSQASVVDLLGEQPGPSPQIVALCDRIREVIRSKRPPDEDSLTSADPQAMAAEAGGQMNQNVQGDADRVAGAYDNTLGAPPAAAAAPPGEAPAPIPGASSGDIDATAAAPDPVPAEDVSLEADVTASAQRMDEAGMNSPAAMEVRDGPIAEAREAQGELQATAERDPAEVMAEQEGELAGARGDMAALQEQALAALETARAGTTGGVTEQRGAMVGTEEQQRAEAGRRAQEIFTTAQTAVTNLLNPLPGQAMQLWEDGVAVESQRFEQSLARVQRWIDERHEGVGGAIVGVWDSVTGLPDWVTEEYDHAEQTFGDGVCALILEISTSVNTVIASCQALIAQADRDIAAVYDSLPAELQEWAAGERERFQGQLSGLSQRANETRDNFDRDLAQRASQAVQDVRVRVNELREAAKGLLGRIVDAIAAFIDDPARAIINGLLSILGIAPSAFWALVARIEQVIDDIADDPLGFANNLVAALAQGFQQFFDNFGTHFLNGLLGWLFSGLGSVGVQVPSDFSLGSIITFFLQLMGLSWANIRRILARHIGEENVELIERAWEFISTMIEMGPAGIYELIKEQLNPQNLLDMVLQMARDFVIETLIQQVVMRVIGLLNPAGAIVQAIEVIYKVGKWVFENAARIFTLIETVVNGIADVIAGNIGGMANAVEGALAQLMIPVIDFLASLLGLGDLPQKVADVIKGFQEMVLGYVDRAIGWVVQRVRGLLARLRGEGAEDDERTDEQKAADLDSAVAEATEINEDKSLSPTQIRDRMRPIKTRYRLTRLELVEANETDTSETVYVVGEINPRKQGENVEHMTKMPLVTLTWSYTVQDPVEYRRQLQEHEDTTNNMSIDRWSARRNAFLFLQAAEPRTRGRPPGSAQLQRQKRVEFRNRILRRLAERSPGAETDPTEIARVDALLVRQDATHVLDIVATGEPAELGLGDRSINRSIGGQWPRLLPTLEAAIMAIDPDERRKLRMNVRFLARRSTS